MGSVVGFGNFAAYSAQTTYQPRYGVVGYRTETTTEVYTFCYAVLSAFDLHQEHRRTRPRKCGRRG